MRSCSASSSSSVASQSQSSYPRGGGTSPSCANPPRHFAGASPLFRSMARQSNVYACAAHWRSWRTRSTPIAPLAVLWFRDKSYSRAYLPFSGHFSEPLRFIDSHTTQRRRKALRDPLRVFGFEFASPRVLLIAGVCKDERTIGFFLCRCYCASFSDGLNCRRTNRMDRVQYLVA